MIQTHNYRIVEKAVRVAKYFHQKSKKNTHFDHPILILQVLDNGQVKHLGDPEGIQELSVFQVFSFQILFKILSNKPMLNDHLF